jgi:hypothetical protein
MSRQKKKNTLVEEPVKEENKVQESKLEKVKEPEVEIDLSNIKVKKTKKEESDEFLDKFIKEETKLVKGKFRNFEIPGASQRIFYKKYPHPVPVFDKVMHDGEIYEIPLYVARHLNGIDVTAKGINGKINSCAYPTHGFKMDPSKGIPESREEGGIIMPSSVPTKWTRRYGFESLEFNSPI